MKRPDQASAYDIIARFRATLSGTVAAGLRPERALDALFAAHHGPVYSVCRRLVLDPERAAELTQETFIVAFRKLDSFQAGTKFSTWLYGIARMLARNANRKKRDLLADDGILEVSDGSAGAVAALRTQEREELLRRVSQATLSPLEQEAVHLRYVEGLSQPAITDILGLDNAAGARALLQRCRRRLSRALRAELTRLGHGSSFVREAP